MINSRQKGAAGERELARFLEGFGWKSKRGQQHSGSPDSPDVVSELPWFVECKRTQNAAPLKWMEKATEDAGGEKPPMIFWRPNRGRWMVMCWASDLLERTDMSNEKKLCGYYNGKPIYATDEEWTKAGQDCIDAMADKIGGDDQEGDPVTMPKEAYLAALKQAKDAGYRQAIAEMQGAETPVEQFIQNNLPEVSSHPIMDDEDAIKQALAEKLRANKPNN